MTKQDNDKDFKWLVPPGLKTCVIDFIYLFFLLYSKNYKGTMRPLMICGDTGVGKSMFVEIFINLYKKDYHEKVTIFNCATISSSLIISELFGYKKGAFTGADKDKLGLLKVADGGLLVLEEIGELPKDGQAKLLTFLENGGRFYELGGIHEQKSDVTIISTTNRPQEDFRIDFWNRFFQFYVPALYERRLDCLYYLHHKFPDMFFTLSKSEVFVLLAYNWPGNVREIENLGFLIKWKDRSIGFKNKEIQNNNETSICIPHYRGILRNKYKYTSLNFNLNYYPILELVKSDKKIFLAFKKFMNYLGFDTREMELAFDTPELKNITFAENSSPFTNFDLNSLDLYFVEYYEINRFYLSIDSLCMMFLYWIHDNDFGCFPNCNLLEMKKGDLKFLNWDNIDNCYKKWPATEFLELQKVIFDYRKDVNNIEFGKRDHSPHEVTINLKTVCKNELDKILYKAAVLALEQNNGKVTKAASQVGLDPRTFNKLIERHNKKC
jgi:hypothetical protein